MQAPYETYYWQDDVIRLRLRQPKDARAAADDEWDSPAWALVHEETVLPPRVTAPRPDGDSDEPNPDAPSFIIETLSGEYVGHIHFNYINERHGTFSVGMILSKKQRGKGYGKAAMRLLLEYAFNERRLHKFNGYCLDINAASVGMMESLGCVREGTVRQTVFLHGAYHDQFLYGLTADEYRARRKAASLNA